MPHPHLSKIPRVTEMRERERWFIYSSRHKFLLFVEVDSVMVLPSSITTATRMFSMFACVRSPSQHSH